MSKPDTPPPWVVSIHAGETREGLAFSDVVAGALVTPQFVAQHSRLSGRPVPSSVPIESIIDEACGIPESWAASFVLFVWDAVWLRFAPLDTPKEKP